MDHNLPGVPPDLLKQQKLHVPTGALPITEQPGRQHPGVIDHQQITGIQIVDDIMENTLAGNTGLPVHQHDPRGVPWLDRRLGDKVFRQIKPEIGFFHFFRSFW